MALGYHDDGCYQCGIYGDCLKCFGERTRPPCAELAEEKFTSINTGSPKLPTIEECEKEIQQYSIGELSTIDKCIIKGVYYFIERQLRARA